ncbi:solute carrier family 46 member 2 isoform X1 [Heptranchias perlo]|uniref:solute carrier family 46 member 2 isoform X1 n=1 Tax=Heptranchias perlo TaxID=212740 RepID=UPI00355948D4
MCEFLRSFIEPVVALDQIASAFYDTALLMMVQARYSAINSSTCSPMSANDTTEDEEQDCVSHFYIIYNTLSRLLTILSTFYFAKLGDLRSRKITIIVPLLGCLISRSLLLLVILWDLPLDMMFATATLNGLSGGFTAYWTGVMALVSITSSENKRSIRLITTECTYGLAGFIGSILSGYIFLHFKSPNSNGSILVACSLALYFFSLSYCILALKVPPKIKASGPHSDKKLNKANARFTDKSQCDNVGSSYKNSLIHEAQQANRISIDETGSISRFEGNDEIENLISVNGQTEEMSRVMDTVHRIKPHSLAADAHKDKHYPDKVTFSLLIGAGILYDIATKGAIDVLPIFVLKKPLQWNAVWVGYGNASEYAIYFTSFLGVCLFCKWTKDFSMIVIGMVSFSSGILIMAFVKWTYLYFIARAVMMFALIPLPTIRSVISKQIEGTSYGKAFGVLQILLTLTGVIASTIFLKIYMSTQGWYPTLCFILSSIISCLSVIPIIIVERRLSEPSGYSRIPED